MLAEKRCFGYEQNYFKRNGKIMFKTLNLQTTIGEQLFKKELVTKSFQGTWYQSERYFRAF